MRIEADIIWPEKLTPIETTFTVDKDKCRAHLASLNETQPDKIWRMRKATRIKRLALVKIKTKGYCVFDETNM